MPGDASHQRNRTQTRQTDALQSTGFVNKSKYFEDERINNLVWKTGLDPPCSKVLTTPTK